MSTGEAVYEMLWDCKYCGQKKLLGITHRFCASCGAPQDPQARYFPPDHERVPVQGHPYVGADVTCPACRQPMSRAAKCCTNCGSPIDKGAEVARRADVVVPPPGGYGAPQAFVPPGPQPYGHTTTTTASTGKRSLMWLFLLVGGVVLAAVILLVVVASWKRDGVFEVTGHTWERSIAIERYEAVRKRVWCDDAPAGARVLSRAKEQRGTKKEPDGEVCGTRKQDLGNGSYKEVKECTPKYRDVPVMADKCDVEITEWRPTRKLTEKGESLAETPRWPASRVGGGTCIGCEREGARIERYTVELVDTKTNKPASCNLPEVRWSTFARGSKWKGEVRVMTSTVDCDELQKL